MESSVQQNRTQKRAIGCVAVGLLVVLGAVVAVRAGGALYDRLSPRVASDPEMATVNSNGSGSRRCMFASSGVGPGPPRHPGRDARPGRLGHAPPETLCGVADRVHFDHPRDSVSPSGIRRSPAVLTTGSARGDNREESMHANASVYLPSSVSTRAWFANSVGSFGFAANAASL